MTSGNDEIKNDLLRRVDDICPHGRRHGGAWCGDCAADKLECFNFFGSAIGPKRFNSLLASEKYSQAVDGLGWDAPVTDKPEAKNTRGDWFDPFGGDADPVLHASLVRGSEIRILRQTIANQDNELRVLRQACKAAGDEIRELHAQRKPEQHGAYLLTRPDTATSPGMYVASAVLLALVGGLLAWWWS